MADDILYINIILNDIQYGLKESRIALDNELKMSSLISKRQIF